MVRLFIGVLLPEDLKDNAITIQHNIKKFVDAKFVERENLHISLSFLGDTDENEIGGIKEKLDQICSRYKNFEVKIGQLKFIPSENFLRVIALDSESDQLKMLSKEIKKEIGGDVKPPHLTLCRVRKVLDKEKLLHSKTAEFVFAVTSASLIKSVVSRNGPTYTSLHDSHFG